MIIVQFRAGALIAWARQSGTAPVQNELAYEGPLQVGFDLLRRRSDLVQKAPDDRARSLAELERMRAELVWKWRQNPQEWESFPQQVDGEYLMLWPGQFATGLQKRRGVVVPSSMRQVDRTAELTITQGYGGMLCPQTSPPVRQRQGQPIRRPASHEAFIMGSKQIRIGQLIAPFGPGSIYTDRRGVPHVVAGLDHWFMRWDQARGRMLASDNRGEFERFEPRLSALLGVDRFCLPPDYRGTRRGFTAPPNALLYIPGLRFPRWYRHTKTGALRRFNLHTARIERPPRRRALAAGPIHLRVLCRTSL